MHKGVNFYNISETGGKRNILIKKEQANLAQLALVFKVIIDTIHITYIFKIFVKLSRYFALEFKFL